jgi:transposase InsO family protein
MKKLLAACGTTQSFSPTGSPYHNAVMESFFSSMKKEELYRTNYTSAQNFKTSVEKYIVFYNTKRPHITLSYKTPSVYESAYSANDGRI